MKNKETIRQLYNLIQEDFNRKIVSKNEYKNVSKKSDDLLEELRKTITDKEYDILGDFIDSYTELAVIESEEYFVKGFSIANKLRDESLIR